MTWLDDNAGWLTAARQHWAPKRSEQVQIRAWLSQPMVFDGYDQITIEGGLQSVVCSLETGRMPDDVFSGSGVGLRLFETDIQIPICDVQVNIGGDLDLPIACVSSGWFSPDATQTVRWIRCRPRAESYAMKTVNVAMAEFKATNNPVATVTANYMDFWAIGDSDMLRTLLVDLPQIGADRSCGMGSVQGWEVTVHKQAHWPSWQDETGRVMRAMPHGYMRDATQYDTRHATLRAPYWNKRTKVLCDVPIQEIGRTS